LSHIIDPGVLVLLCCPETSQPVRIATADELRRVNEPGVVNRAGRGMGEPVLGGLVRKDGEVLYPCREGIPTLLVSEGIFLAEK
jgi:uncharacterized protein YbaR (Trm112 family)